MRGMTSGTCIIYGIAKWIDDEIGKRKSRCFKRLAVWADSLEGGTAHQAPTSAIAFNKSWIAELQIGDLPGWLSTDNCPAVVAVTICLQIGSEHCGVHLMQFVFDSAT